MSEISRGEAIKKISNWTFQDIVALLQKNGLAACSQAVIKRQVGGDELLHLTEVKLALWNSDLTRQQSWSLLRFVENLTKNPEKYIDAENVAVEDEEALSDSGSWGSDFEDDPEEGNELLRETRTKTSPEDTRRSLDFSNHLKLFQRNDELAGKEQISKKNHPSETKEAEEDDDMYTNVVSMRRDVAKVEPPSKNSSMLHRQRQDEKKKEACGNGNMFRHHESWTKAPVAPKFPLKNPSKLHGQCDKASTDEAVEDESNYTNQHLAAPKFPLKSQSKLNGQCEKNSVEKLRDQLNLKFDQKPTLCPKPKSIVQINATDRNKFIVPRSESIEPPIIFKNPSPPEKIWRSLPAPPEQNAQRKDNWLPKPPPDVCKIIDIAPIDSDEAYEPIDEQIFQKNQKISMTRAASKQSLVSGQMSPTESIYHTPSVTDYDEEGSWDDTAGEEIYSRIPEYPGCAANGGYLIPSSVSRSIETPPPLPVKPASSISATSSPTSSLTRKNERSPDKKSDTLPHAGSNSSLERATRPLPPPPERQANLQDKGIERQASYVDKPWYHNLTRQQANALIRKPPDDHDTPPNGYFLIRPSVANPNSILTLVLWYIDKVYNIAVRKRQDGRYALGSEKENELCFANVQDIISFYMAEELILYSGGAPAGGTRLKHSPEK